MKRSLLLIGLLAFIFVAVACGTVNEKTSGDNSGPVTEDSSEQADKKEDLGNKDYNDEENVPEKTEPLDVEQNVTGLIPNENGQIMILMYHRIGDRESTWTRTRENFRRDLQTLYDKGYRLISLKDYLDNKIDLPLGTTPVILTFDDGTSGQFDFIEGDEDLQIDPGSAVGIMKEFYEEHPDFGLEATFYVNQRPFNYRYWKEAVQKIVELGMDIGNHTLTHQNFKKLPSDKYPAEIGGLVAHIKEALPDYVIDSMVLPNGGYPQDVDKALEGEFQGVKYKNRALLLVGARPAPAPTDPVFNPLKLPRIRADEENLYRWLDYFDKHPEKRYVSNGIMEGKKYNLK